MAKNINRERLYGDIEKLKEDHVRDGSHAKLTREERRQERIKNHYSREHYRRYGRDNEITYASVVFRETAIAVFAAVLYGLILAMAVLSLIAIMAAAQQSPVLAVIIATAVSYFLFWPHLRRMIKRLRFAKKLRRSCENGKMRLHVYRSPLKSLYRAGGVPDFAVECGDTVYECMFYPRLRRLTVLRFEKPGEVAVVTGILKSRISDAMGLHERVRIRPFGFEAQTNAQGHRVIKAVILNPVPYQIFCYDARDKRVVPGGSGSAAFDCTLYTANGFLNTIDRHNRKDSNK